MPFINLAPYSDIHNLNLDWIIDTMKELVKAWEGYGAKVTATAHLADRPGVEVTGDFKTEVNFDFAIVRGEKGEPGNDGERGEQGVPGPQGAGLQILDTYETIEDLRRAHATGVPGDAYLVGRNNVYVLYIWSTESNDWHEAGSLSSPSPSSESPLMDGEASAGAGLTYSRKDHRHPSDNAKLDKATNDGSKTELYAVAGTEQNVIEVTDVPATGKVVMYDQVRGNVRTQAPIEDNDCVRRVDLKNVEDIVDELTANGVLPVVAESQAPTLIGYPSTGESGLLTFGSNSDGDPTVKVTFDGYSREGEMVDVYDQVAFDKEHFVVQNNHMKLKAQGATLESVYPIGSVYFETNNINPATIFGFGTWELIGSKLAVRENVFGNGNVLALSDGASLYGPYKSNYANSTLFGKTIGTSAESGGSYPGSSVGLGIATKAQLGANPNNSGLIVETETIYSWKRTA